MTIHNDDMTTYLPGPLVPADLAILADRIDTLTPGSIDRREYVAGYRHAVIDASAAVMALYAAALDAAPADEDDAAPADEDDAAPAAGLAGVAADLLRLAVRLDLADDADIQRRMDALGGADK